MRKQMQRRWKVYMLGFSLLLASIPKALPEERTFTTIDFPGASFTGAIGINSRGDIVGRYLMPGGVFHGFLLSGRDFTTIDPPGATYTEADGISAEGDIVGTYISAGVTHGFLLSGGNFSTIDPPGSIFTDTQGISPSLASFCRKSIDNKKL
jgi:hypothetical protein